MRQYPQNVMHDFGTPRATSARRRPVTSACSPTTQA